MNSVLRIRASCLFAVSKGRRLSHLRYFLKMSGVGVRGGGPFVARSTKGSQAKRTAMIDLWNAGDTAADDVVAVPMANEVWPERGLLRGEVPLDGVLLAVHAASPLFDPCL